MLHTYCLRLLLVRTQCTSLEFFDSNAVDVNVIYMVHLFQRIYPSSELTSKAEIPEFEIYAYDEHS